MLKKPCEPPRWFTEGTAHLCLGFAIAFTIVSATLPLSVQFSGISESGASIPNWPAIIEEAGFSACALAFFICGIYCLMGGKYVTKSHDDLHLLIANEMEDYASRHLIEKAASEEIERNKSNSVSTDIATQS